MSAPAVYPITIQRGVADTLTIELQYEDDAGLIQPVVLTDAAIALRAWSAFGGDQVLNLTTGNGGVVITDATAGLADVVFAAEQTADATWASGEYVLDLTLADATPIRLAKGSLALEQEAPV